MFDRSAFIEPVAEYINEHFSSPIIKQWEHEKNESLNFKIDENEITFTLRIMDECLRDIEVTDVKDLLASYNVAQVMRDIRDFPIVVTNSGCIFGSP
ncbi:MAG: hypothetical protein AAF304_09430 [Pseudomonadota bacterium]